MKHKIFAFILSISSPAFSATPSVLGMTFWDQQPGNSFGTRAIVIGQQEIGRDIIQLNTLQFLDFPTDERIGFSEDDIGENEKPKFDSYRVNCKEKTFALHSEAEEAQWKLVAYSKGWRFNFKGATVNSKDKSDTIYVNSEMIDIFKKSCK